jgi:hypothetical protein
MLKENGYSYPFITNALYSYVSSSPFKVDNSAKGN